MLLYYDIFDKSLFHVAYFLKTLKMKYTRCPYNNIIQTYSSSCKERSCVVQIFMNQTLAFKETTLSYSKFVYSSTFLCEPVPLRSQPIQICCTTYMQICKPNYDMYVFKVLSPFDCFAKLVETCFLDRSERATCTVLSISAPIS
jgi:hypothetical protein